MSRLAKLYEERGRWVPAFLNSNFFAGMSSSQRLESMNIFFDGYLHSSTTLKVFVNQFENTMQNKVEDEILSDFECFEDKLKCSSSSPKEKQFQEAYTHEIFKRECMTVLPDRYILDRWKNDIKRKHIYVSTCTDDIQHNPILERYETLRRLARDVLEIGAESIENFNVLEKLLIDLKDNFPRSCDKQPLSQRKNSVGATFDVVKTEVVRSPIVVKRKGRPRMKQLKSSMEEAVSKPKKKRNTAATRNLAQSTSTTGVGGSAYGDGSTSNMEYPMSMPHSNDGYRLDKSNAFPEFCVRYTHSMVHDQKPSLHPISMGGGMTFELELIGATALQKAQKTKGNLHIQGCIALLQIWACEHLGIGQKNVEINQPFPRFLAWTHQRMFSKMAMEVFSNNVNVLSVLAAMPWEQQESVVQEAMEILQETHGSLHTAILRNDGAGPSNTTQTPFNQWQLELQAERTKREALARHVKRLKDELHRVKGLVATVIESSPIVQQNQTPPSQNLEQNQPPIQSQLPIQTPIVDLPNSPSKAVKRGKPAKKKAKAAMVDLASSPSKWDNEGEAAVTMVDLK
uniref:Protein FAR1-RELATED SEQUENCE n=1 Tax=Fagus sylvatica TaxID=28930 RepID=A0A2N9H6N9_FAGSY